MAARRGLGPAARVGTLSLVLGAVAIGVHLLLLGGMDTPFDRGLVPIWLLATMFAATEGFAIHLRVRRGGHAMSLSEIPMVLGLLSADPTVLLLTRVFGGGAGLAVLRRQRGVKLGFNLALLTVQVTAASLVFHAIAGASTADVGPRQWLAAYAAMVVTDLLSAVLVTAVIALHDDPGEWRRLPSALRGTPLVAVTTSVGLVSALAVEYDPRAVLLLGVVSLITYLAYRGYVRQTHGHSEVEELYGFTRALDDSYDARDVALLVLQRVRDLLRAENAVLIAPTPDGRYVVLRLHDQDELTVTELAQMPGDAWWHSAAGGEPVLLPEQTSSPRAGFRDGLAVPLTVSSGGTGVLYVTDSLADHPTFTRAQIPLFQALANHAGVAISKAHLVAELRREVANTEYLALHDQLTGLPNRQQFTGLLDSAVGGAEPAAVALLDLDRFKEVNEALGHDTGDALLREIGARLQRNLGDRGVVARLGGDEFGLLLPGIGSHDEAVALVDSLADSLEHPVPIGELSLTTRASVGIAFAPDHGGDATTLMRRADVAMYVAKETRSGGRVYEPADDEHTPHRLALIADLRKAIQRRDISVVFQPKIDPLSGVVSGAEALARWHHPTFGSVPPDQFITLAEHSGLIRPLTLHVLEVALRRCAAWRRDGHDLHVAVNLSPNSLHDASLPDVVSRLLAQCDVPPRALTLEITESTIMADPTASLATLDRLHALGVQLAIDDFGTGYSSLGRLRDLPIHEVKIDKSFVQRLVTDHRDRAVVRSAVQLGHALDLAVVAEGVEDDATYAHLTQEGCNLVQGYFVSRPLPADEFASWLKGRSPASARGR